MYNELFVIGITVDVLIDIVRERVISDRGNGRGDSDFLERSAVDEREALRWRRCCITTSHRLKRAISMRDWDLQSL